MPITEGFRTSGDSGDEDVIEVAAPHLDQQTARVQQDPARRHHRQGSLCAPESQGESNTYEAAVEDAFLCAALGTKIDIAFRRNLGTGLFGGEGFILQKLQGDGMAFLSVGGTVIEKELRNDKLLVDTGCLVAMEPTVEYSIERAGNLKSMFFGGEGLFLASLSGYGKVWLQSLPFSRLANRIIANAPSAGGSSRGEGSLLGGLGLGQR